MFNEEKQMNRFWYLTGLTLTVALGPTLAAAAQQPTPMVAFKATMEGQYRGLVIPLPALIVSEQLTCKGQADLLGPITSAEHHFVHLSVDGKLASVTDGIAVLAAPNGDALFITYSGLAKGDPAVTGETGRQELAFTVTGGRGRFAGATGSGVIRDVLFRQGPREQPLFTVTRTLEGVVSAPKP
jgi:hypothetical protein